MSNPGLSWGRHLAHLRRPERRLRVLHACGGIATSRPTFRIINVATLDEIFELDERYRTLLESVFPDGTLHLGSREGDVVAVPLGSLVVPVDILLSGPPCPPWSAAGCRRGRNDARADVFTVVMRWTVHLIKAGGLLAVVIENVPGINQDLQECSYFLARVIEALNIECPEFVWRFRTINTEEYAIPHHRERVYLRGLRRIVAGGAMPASLPPFGNARLEEFLDMTVPNAKRDSLGGNRRVNLRHIEVRVRCLLARGAIKPGQIACVPIDRAVHKVYGCPIFLDRCPTLTTRNWYLFVFSVEDLDKVDRLRRLFRYLTPLERLRLQGCPDSDRNSLSFVAARHAAGNAFSSCAMAAQLGPLIDAMGGMPAGSLLAWPPPGLASGVVGPSAMNFLSGDVGGSDRRVISRR